MCSFRLNSAQAGATSFLMILIKYLKEFLTLVNVKVHAPIDVIKQIFRIITNAATSSADCRALFWKSGFMSEFVEAYEKGTCPRKSRFQVIVLKFWFDLLLALSYDKHSQTYISKMNDILDTFAELHFHWGEIAPEKTLLLIRNCSFEENLKPRIAQHGLLLSILVQELENKNILLNLMAAESLWAIANHTQRARAILKQKNVAEKLNSALTRVQYSSEVGKQVDTLVPRLTAAIKASLELLA